jgi:phosphoglucosamine mutase
MRADAGIVVSASHNPYNYNGIKIFDAEGYKLPDSVEEEIERIIDDGTVEKSLPVGNEIGRAKRIEDALGRYIVFAKSTFPKNQNLKGLRIVLDCANGAAYKCAPTVLEELGAEVIRRGVNPSGTNINEKCGALHPETTAQAVIQYRADMGIALDGDADRLILIDEKGCILDGDVVLALLGIEMKKLGTLKKDTIVITPMTNIGFLVAMKQNGIKTVTADVGDRYVVEVMRREGYNLGGEQSGHIVLLDHSTTGDGLVSALNVLGVMTKYNKKLSELKGVMQAFPQVLLNIKVRAKEKFENFPSIKTAIENGVKQLGDEGRVLVRYSGTEPLARVMVEGRENTVIGKIADDIANAIRRELG